MNPKNLPSSFRIKVNYNKKTEAFWAECIDNPNINAIASNFSKLMVNLNASIFDQYKVKKVDEAIAYTFFPVPSPFFKIRQKLASYLPPLGSTSETIDFTTSPVGLCI